MTTNGYVIYPGGHAAATLKEARQMAKELSAQKPYECRVENCSTEEVMGRYIDGERIA